MPPWIDRLGDRWRPLRTALDVQKRFGDLQANVTAGSLTLTLFLSLFPLLLVAVAVLGWVSHANTDLAADLIDDLGLTGDAAQIVTEAINSATRSRRTSSVIGFLSFLWAGLGIVSAAQGAINRAWQVPGAGIADKGKALVWLVGAALGAAVSGFASAYLVRLLPPWAAPLTTLASAGLLVLLFWWTYAFLSSAKVGWRPHLPGAVVAGVGVQALLSISAWYLPRTVARSSALYGSLGVVFALIAWLFLFGRLMMYATVYNVIRYEVDAGTVTLPLEAPAIGERSPTRATRGGLAEEHPDDQPPPPPGPSLVQRLQFWRKDPAAAPSALDAPAPDPAPTPALVGTTPASGADRAGSDRPAGTDAHAGGQGRTDGPAAGNDPAPARRGAGAARGPSSAPGPIDDATAQPPTRPAPEPPTTRPEVGSAGW